MKLSIIITLYNRAELVIKTIESCNDIVCNDVEIIVIDDGSTDNPIINLNPFIDNKKINYYWKENGGAASAKNFGAKKAVGEMIFFLDSDDTIVNPDCLKEIITSFSDKKDFYYSDAVFIENENGRHLSSTPFNAHSEDLYDYVLKYPLNYPGKPAYFFNRVKFIASGGFSESYHWGDAMLFWRIFLKNASYRNISKPCYVYNFLPNDSVSRSRGQEHYKRVLSTLSDTFTILEPELNVAGYTQNWLLVIIPLCIKNREYSKACKFFLKFISNPFKALLAAKYVISRRLNRG